MGRRKEELQVNVPSYFRCPISLEVMKSPVSLCTGVTYDRSSIKRWLDSGNNTCPATMQVLHSTDLVPNLTLHRLIQRWDPNCNNPIFTTTTPSLLLRQIQTSSDPLLLLQLLNSLPPSDISSNPSALPTLTSLLTRRHDDPRIRDSVVRVISHANLRLSPDPASLSAIVSVLSDSPDLDSKIAASNVLASIATAGADSRSTVAATAGAIKAMARLANEATRDDAADSALTCLAELAKVKRARVEMVNEGAVRAAAAGLGREGPAAESAVRVLEAVAGCAEGRAEICGDEGRVVKALVGRMMKLSIEGRESALAVLWSVCHLHADKRAREAVAERNGLTRILMVMQSGCSPAAREVARDLLRVFRVDSMGCLANYDSITAHIMPF